jgi:hypothetical protein
MSSKGGCACRQRVSVAGRPEHLHTRRGTRLLRRVSGQKGFTDARAVRWPPPGTNISGPVHERPKRETGANKGKRDHETLPSVLRLEPRMSVSTLSRARGLQLRSVRIPPVMFVALLCLAVAGLADAVLPHEKGISGDEPFYVRMATHPGAAHSFPYAYRIAVPWLVHALPFSHVVSFQLLALVAIAASGAALYALMGEFDIPGQLAGALAVGLAVSPTLLVALLRHGRNIDPATILVMILGCLFIVRRQRLALALTLLIGVAVKETTLFLIPFAYAVWAERLVDLDALRDLALVSAAPIAGYIALRVSIPAIGSQYVPGYAGSFLHIRLEILHKAFSGIELRRLAYTYGPLWVVAPLALRNFSFARRGLVLVAVCVMAMTVSYDAQRVIFLAAPIFYVAAAFVLKHRRRAALATVIALLAVDVGYAVYMQVRGVRHGLDTNPAGAIPIR